MFNSVSLIGNLGADPDLKYTPNGTCIANMRLAVNDKRRDQSGNVIENTYWFTCTAFGKIAEVAGNYCSKGTKIGIQGKLIQRDWEDQSGNKRSAIEIRVDTLELLGGNGHGQGQSQNNGQGQRNTQGNGQPNRLTPPPPPPPGQGGYYQPHGGQPDPNYLPPSDDIPF